MTKRFIRWLHKEFDEEAYKKNDTTIKKSNLKFYVLFDLIMIGLLLALYASTFFSDYAVSLKLIYLLFISMSVAELLVIHFVDSKNDNWILYASYFGVVKAYVFCLLTSVVFNRNDSAITFFVFMILIPVCFLIRPKIMYSMQVVATLVFCVTTALLKPVDIASGDIMSCLLFFVISIVISAEISKVRIHNISMATEEHQRSVEMKNQRDLLEIAMKSASMCAWIYDSKEKKITPTFTAKDYGIYNREVTNVPDSVIEDGLVHPESVPTMRMLYERAQRGESRIQGDVRLRGSNKERFQWFHVSMNPEKAEKENLKYIGTSEDITERKNMELQYAEQLRALNSANEGNLITKGIWNLTCNSQEMEDANSKMSLPLESLKTYDEAMGILTDAIFPEKKKKEMIHILDRKNLIQAFHKGIHSYDLEYQRRTNQDCSIWVNMHVRVCQVPGKEDIVSFGFSYDITEEVVNKSIISRLVASEYEFLGTVDINTQISIVRKVQESVKETICAVGAYQQSVNYTKSSIEAARLVIVKEELENVLDKMRLENVIENLEKEETYMITFSTMENGELKRKKLEYCYLDATKTTILYYRNDITELYRQEQEHVAEIKKALKQVEQANCAKTDFLSRMSHDMRTPINGIIGMTRLTQEIEGLPEEVYQNLNSISDSSRFLLSLINDTLDMSRIEQNKIILVPEIIDTELLIDNILTMVKASIHEKKLHLEYIPIHLSTRYIRSDRVRLQQVILNIIGNAVKFTPAGGKITLTVECMKIEDNKVYDRICIEDTGIGMSKEFIKKIYEPFSQENSTLTSRQVGTGLGMSIVKNIVELMGGTIQIDSSQGKGTKITLDMCFEIAKKENNPEIQNLLDTSKILKGRRILLVEDHPLNLTIAKRVLEKQEVLVETAENGKEAVDKFAESKIGYYEVILMDIRMPVMTGLEAAKIIRSMNREDAKSVIIIAMSANAFAEDVKKSKEVGMNDHLSKPIEPELVYQTVARHILNKEKE